MSLDGFIAGPGGDMSWLGEFADGGTDPAVDELIARTGAILVGATTFGGQDPNEGRPGEGEAFGGGWDGPQFVLTHHRPAKPSPGITFVPDLETAITASSTAAGDKAVNVLGANVAAQCLAAGVLDEVMVSVMPVLLGEGTRLFEQSGGQAVRLEQMSVTHTPTATNIWYRVSP